MNGVAIIVSREVHNAVKEFAPVSDRISLLMIKAEPCNMNIIQVYAPTTQSTEE